MALSMPSSSFWVNILSNVDSDVEMYNFIALLLMGGNNVGGFDRYLLINSKAC